MKAAVFSIVPYEPRHQSHGWPTPADGYSADVAQASMQRALEQFQLADELGFDWVTVAKHHYSPASLTPNPMVMAAAVIERVKRARVACSARTSRFRTRSAWPRSSRCSTR